MHGAAEWLVGPDRNLTRFGELPRYREGLYRLRGGTYAWMVPNGSWGETNLGLVSCGGRSVLIDTAWDLRFTREFLAAAHAIVEKSPVECVVNTHADGDHCWGNQLFAGRTIIGSHRCIAQMDHLRPRALEALRVAARLARRLPVEGVAEFGRYVENMFEPYTFRGIELVKPTDGFSGEKTLTLGGVDIVLREVGPAHTDGDVVAWVPSERVAYAGDTLFVGVTPVMWAGPVENLLSGLRHLLSLDADVIVPGHGPLATREDVQHVIDYWDFVHEALQTRSRFGMPPTEAARSVLLDRAFQSTGFARWGSPERLVTSAHTMYRNWGYLERRLPEKLANVDLLRRQARIALLMGSNATTGCAKSSPGS